MDDGVGIHRLAFLLRGPEPNLACGCLCRAVQTISEPLNHALYPDFPRSCEDHLQKHFPFDFFRARFVRIFRFRLEKNFNRLVNLKRQRFASHVGPASDRRLIAECSLLHGSVTARAACSNCNAIAKSGAGHNALRALVAASAIALPRTVRHVIGAKTAMFGFLIGLIVGLALRPDRQIRRFALARAASSRWESRNCQATWAD